MSDRNFFGKHTLLEKTDRIALSETQPIKEKSENSPLQINNVDSNLLVIILSLLFICCRSFWLFSKFKSTHKSSLSIPRFSKVPCRNCRFLAKNQYLKCAVHPSKVFTKQAVNCLDYCCKHDSD